jgi:hypothetical protein
VLSNLEKERLVLVGVVRIFTSLSLCIFFSVCVCVIQHSNSHIKRQIRCGNVERLFQPSASCEKQEGYTKLDESHGNPQTHDRISRLYVLSAKSHYHDRDTEGNEW